MNPKTNATSTPASKKAATANKKPATSKAPTALPKELSLDELEIKAAPKFDFDLETSLYSEIIPGLWVGGTDDDDVSRSKYDQAAITPSDFDTVVTLYAWANPVDWYVKELRFGFFDHDDVDVDIEDLHQIVRNAQEDLVRGKRVLIRCQAGLNRSGLVAALVLMRHGYTAVDAIELIRARRSANSLFNSHFRQWLREQDLDYWRA